MWILTYEYRKRRYRFLLNEGNAPLSPWKLLAVFGIVVLVLVLLVLLAAR